MIRKILFLFLLLAFQYHCFSQSKTMDSLKAQLLIVKEDTAKLNIYLALAGASPGKENLVYIEPAWNLLDKISAKKSNVPFPYQLAISESVLTELLINNYTSNDITDWNKVIPYLNKRLQGIEKTGNKKRQAYFLYTMAMIHLDLKKDSASFRSYITKSTAIATEIKDSTMIVEGYRFMYSFYKSAGNFTEALNAIQAAVNSSKKLNYQKGLAITLNDFANIYAEFGEKDLALENYREAIDISYKLKDTNQVCNILISLAAFYNTQNDMPKSLEYLNQALQLNNRFSNADQNASIIYRKIAEVYEESKDYKNAGDYYERSLAKSESDNDLPNMLRSLSGLGMLCNKQGRFEKAFLYNNKAHRLLDSVGGVRYKPDLLYSMAVSNFGLKKFSEARQQNDVALVDFKKFWFDIKKLSKMELLASQIDSASGDGFGALAHYKEYTLLTEKIKGEEIRKEAQKDKFKTAIEKQQSEQEKKDAITRRTRNLQYIAIGAFLLLGIFLTYGYVQKNKDKRKIEKAYAELKTTQSQLIQSEKMASLGELTAGIAHEIQNPLNFVNNFSEVSNELVDEMNIELDKGDIEEAKAIAGDIKSNLEKINHHGKRADAIVKGMLQHSRKSEGKKEPTDINTLCDEYLRLSYHGLRAKDKSFNATLKTDFDESIGKINIIPQDIGRVVMNLLTNAFYAVNEKKSTTGHGPQTTATVYEPIVSISTKKNADKIEIKVTDNGNGIPQNIIDKIFQPFFTTKPTGQGTGLGLSLAYDIVKAHSGEIKIDSTGQQGSTFTIILPIINK